MAYSAAAATSDAYKPKFVFHVQLAHGSPTGIISDFSTVKELYRRIADQFTDVTEKDILFCTLNTYKVNMDRLLGAQLCLDDFIFAHVRGQPKEIEVTKYSNTLGLTITDNGAGIAFIKRIAEDSICGKIAAVCVGDHIERLDGESLVGERHFDVALRLRELEIGRTFTLRLVSPLASGFSSIGQANRSGGGKKTGVGGGLKTIRLKATGPVVEEVTELETVAVNSINTLLENFFGVSDSQIATQVWQIGQRCRNPHDFSTAIQNSELGQFGFSIEFIFDLWGAVSDVK